MSASPRLVPIALSQFHRPELDVLRFSAFAFVFLHHALPHSAGEYSGMPKLVAQAAAALGRAGAYGVDLFFCLSAYLITELLRREYVATGKLDVWAFYKRRALRIWPLYYAALLGLAPLMGLLDGAERLPVSYMLAFALFGGNWICAFLGYPGSSFSLLWSVSIEEQFYLLWPWFVRKGVAHLERWAWAMIAIAWVTRALLVVAQVQHPGVWCNTLARLDPIAAGILLSARLSGNMPKLSTPTRGACVLFGLFGFLAAGAFGTHSGWGSLLWYPIASLCSLGLLVGTLGADLRSAVLCYLGKISFGLYVFHAAVLKWVPTVPLAFLLTILAAAASNQFLERPFLRLKERFARV